MWTLKHCILEFTAPYRACVVPEVICEYLY